MRAGFSSTLIAAMRSSIVVRTRRQQIVRVSRRLAQSQHDVRELQNHLLVRQSARGAVVLELVHLIDLAELDFGLAARPEVARRSSGGVQRSGRTAAATAASAAFGRD